MVVTGTYRRVFIKDKDGNDIDSSNPLPVTQTFNIATVIEETDYDLAAAAYSGSATPAYDYILDNVTFNFSTTESRTITITSNNSTKLFEETNTNADVAVTDINFSQGSGQSFTVEITQTSGACTVDIAANIKGI